MSRKSRKDRANRRGRLPVATAEDVGYSEQRADEDDREAQARAAAADARQTE